MVPFSLEVMPQAERICPLERQRAGPKLKVSILLMPHMLGMADPQECRCRALRSGQGLGSVAVFSLHVLSVQLTVMWPCAPCLLVTELWGHRGAEAISA